jgi:RNA polymerase sigma-70 factor (ECF subfamily)
MNDMPSIAPAPPPPPPGRRPLTPATPEFRQGLLGAVPRLRAFAIGLCGKNDQAEDLVQETLVKAWANRDSFQPGTNLLAWLHTILRNEFYTQFRTRWREVADVDGQYSSTLTSAPAQDSHVEFQDFRAALAKLPDDQRVSLLLVGASGLSYEEAARICDCAVGTMKSRVFRARARLAAMLNWDPKKSAERIWESARATAEIAATPSLTAS